VVLRRAPTERDEWRLVRVTVRITDVTRDGDTWRAEASLGAAGTLPIVGVARSGIPADVVAEGRSATITGIVKRAHPSATDQRFGIAPRDPTDIRLGPAPRGGGGSAGDDTGASTDGDAPTVGDTATARPVDGPAVGTSLEGVPGLLGRRVRVAGALKVIDTPLLTLDDGSGRGLVRLLDSVARFEPPLHLGEVINVTGTVATRDVGGWEIVASADGVVRASRLALPMASGTASAAPSPSAGDTAGTAVVGQRTDRSGGDLGRPWLAIVVGLVVAGLAGLVALAGVLAMRSGRRRAERTDGAHGGDQGPSTRRPA
jgi:hypothetical protein